MSSFSLELEESDLIGSLGFGELGLMGTSIFFELDDELEDFFLSSSGVFIGTTGGLIGESFDDELEEEDFCLMIGGSFSDSLELLEDFGFEGSTIGGLSG